MTRRLDGNQRGFTLVELMIVIAIIGVLAAIAIPIYSNMQGRARTAKAQSDLRGLYSALTVFGVHCGDVPAAGSFPVSWTGGDLQCPANSGPLAMLGATVYDFSNIRVGPFYQPGSTLTPPVGWTYAYTRTGAARFTLVGASSVDMPSGSITFP